MTWILRQFVRVTSKQAYRKFLLSDFWIELSARLRTKVGKCHRKEHGFGNYCRFFPYRDDERFSAIMHRTGALHGTILSGRFLRPRDEAFLANAMRLYPPTATDRAMEFHCKNVFKFNKLMKESTE